MKELRQLLNMHLIENFPITLFSGKGKITVFFKISPNYGKWEAILKGKKKNKTAANLFLHPDPTDPFNAIFDKKFSSKELSQKTQEALKLLQSRGYRVLNPVWRNGIERHTLYFDKKIERMPLGAEYGAGSKPPFEKRSIRESRK